MEIKVNSVKPYEKAALPALQFDVEVEYKRFERVILGVSGYLKSDDGKILSTLSEASFQEGGEIRSLGTFGAKGSYRDKEFEERISNRFLLIAILDKAALDYIEKRRLSDAKRGVILNLELHVTFLVSEALISHLHILENEKVTLMKGYRVVDGYRIAYAYDSDYAAQRNNLWVLSGSGNPGFLRIEKMVKTVRIEIPETDWIYDFVPKLGLGEYFIVEIPRGGDIVKEAWSYVEKAEEAFRRWDSKSVYAYCREAGKLLDRVVKERFSEESFVYRERWGRAYANFEKLASLDLHIEDIKRSQRYKTEEIKIGRADCEYLLIALTKLLIKFAEELLREHETTKICCS
jgi:hypothetical protein